MNATENRRASLRYLNRRFNRPEGPFIIALGFPAPPTRLGKVLRGWGSSPCCGRPVRAVRGDDRPPYTNMVSCTGCLVVVA